MIDRHVAFLRGINVGRANRIGMADLRSLFEELGCAGVQTLLASGNVVFSPPDGGGAGRGSRSERESTVRLERAILDRFGVTTAVIVVRGKELGEAVRHNPLADLAAEPSRFVAGCGRTGPAAPASTCEPIEARGGWRCQGVSRTTSNEERRRKCRRPYGFGRRSAGCLVAPPRRCAPASTASARLASDRSALRTRQAQFFRTLLVMILRDAEAAARLKPLLKECWTPEAIALWKRFAYLWCPSGLAGSKLWTATDRAADGGGTARNLATMEKLVALTKA